jgi:hypothetical protein
MLPKRITTDPAAAIAVVAVAMVAVSFLLSRQTAIRARGVSMSNDQHSIVEDETDAMHRCRNNCQREVCAMCFGESCMRLLKIGWLSLRPE